MDPGGGWGGAAELYMDFPVHNLRVCQLYILNDTIPGLNAMEKIKLGKCEQRPPGGGGYLSGMTRSQPVGTSREERSKRGAARQGPDVGMSSSLISRRSA